MDQIVTPTKGSAHEARRTSVYRYYDSSDLLLYVGVTDRGNKRNVEHNNSKDWWTFVVRQEVTHFENRSEALAAEKSYITLQRPPFNKQHNPDHQWTRAAYLVFVASGGVRPKEMELAAQALRGEGKREVRLHIVSEARHEGGNGWEYAMRTGPESAPIADRIVLPSPVRTNGVLLNQVVRNAGGATLFLHTRHGVRLASSGHSGRIKFHSAKPVQFAFKTLCLPQLSKSMET